MRRLSIADPCSASWEQMEGTPRVRRCAACDRQVHDLSARTEIEATALLLVLGSGGLCVRIERDAEGAIRHAPEPKRPPSSPRAAAGMMAAAAIGVAACSPAASAPPPALGVALPQPAPLVAAAPEPAPPPVTDAALADTDKDGILDAEDACPMEPGTRSVDRVKNGCPAFMGVITQGEIIVLESVRFGHGGRTIDARSQALLEEVAKVLQQNPSIVKIAIEGHASLDEPGASKLGKARAEAVMAALRKLKIEPARLVAESYGVDRPIADNATKDGRERNRRVEFKVLESTSSPLP